MTGFYTKYNTGLEWVIKKTLLSRESEMIALARRCSEKKSVFKNLAKFTRKHLCWSLFFNKVVSLRTETLLKKDSNTGISCEY